jgi:hypothetical protein
MKDKLLYKIQIGFSELFSVIFSPEKFRLFSWIEIFWLIIFFILITLMLVMSN